ncbi:MAG: DNA translocase FtsK 4TM domain-containing protein [Azospirillum sp.]|nr:DNA translocase FtsK 4TM domain-containing protein [Azospirillum sp.]MCA3264902.1 DNA translocase FtsK 4TM domain-containing protein [Azospirillum sp.]MCZ8124401.1 DNA translocase FtsK 4TM domain-containing protein [Magnetospirillum sp.]
MATASRVSNGLFPDGAGAFVRRRLAELAGAALVVLAGLIAAALFTYAPEDPSFSHATDARPQNLLGHAGAAGADLLLQTLGLAAALIPLALLAWGWRLLRSRGMKLWWLRVALLPATVLLAAMALSTWTAPADWPRPLDGGLGGVVGRLFLAQMLALGADLGHGADVLAWAATTLAAVGFVFGLAITWGEYRTAAWAGGIAAKATAKTGAMLFAAGAAIVAKIRLGDPREARAREKRELKRGRAEPSFDGTPDPAPEPAIEPAPERPRPSPAELVERAAPAEKAKPEAKKKPKQAALDLAVQGEYVAPSIELLAKPKTGKAASVDETALAQNARLLESVLDDYGVKGQIVKVRPGPVVTLYELEPAPGTKAARVVGLSDDIARSMSAVAVRVAVVPGRNVIGIELPNASRETVFLRDLLEQTLEDRQAGNLNLVLGRDIGGQPIIVDLARMPHLLIAGTTGSGKSVAINTMILSLLYRLTPSECRFIMVDPKMIELSVYDGIPHLLSPVVTDPKKAVVALKWAVKEMENRYRAMSKLGVRNIAGYNQRLADARKNGESLTRKVQTGFDEAGKPVFEDQPLDMTPLPFIVVVVDEMADLMLVAGKDVEWAVQRLAQMARAAGIHLLMATQRPSVDVITGTIKANFPTRISFQVTSKIDSRTILGEQGAEQLLGQGDMLYMAGGGRITRVHGPFVSDREVEHVVQHLKAQGTPAYVEEVTEDEEALAALDGEGGGNAGGGEGGGSGDALYDQAVALVARERKCSTSFIQRHLQIGYNRAARIVERMEAEGVVGTANHVGKREVLAPKGDYAA